jgi:hypothetical protein
VFRGAANYWAVEPMSHKNARLLLAEVTEIMEDLCDQYEKDEKDEDAAIDDIIDFFPYDDTGGLCDAGDWLELADLGITAETTDDQLADMYYQYQDEAHGEGVHLYGLEEYLCGLRTEAREDAQ